MPGPQIRRVLPGAREHPKTFRGTVERLSPAEGSQGGGGALLDGFFRTAPICPPTTLRVQCPQVSRL